MFIKEIELRNFRSHLSDNFKFTNNVNIIIGPNGSGKTNLLEAIFLICSGQTFRGRDQLFVNYSKNAALLKIKTDAEERELKITLKNDQTSQKEFKINTHKIFRLLNRQKIPTCLFEPNHLQVIYGGPELRRGLIDQFLTQIYPEYQKALQSYKRALSQRNKLLKSERLVTEDELFIWNVRLSEHGQTLVQIRRQWVDYYNNKAASVYDTLSGKKESVKLVYEHNNEDQYGSWLLSKLQASNKRDRLIGFTMNGPHRDDLEFLLNNQTAQITASRGEIRSLILTYKTIEMKFIEDELGQKPIVMLDDVFSELDENRQSRLLNLIKDHQIFITTTHTNTKKLNTIKL